MPYTDTIPTRKQMLDDTASILTRAYRKDGVEGLHIAMVENGMVQYSRTPGAKVNVSTGRTGLGKILGDSNRRTTQGKPCSTSLDAYAQKEAENAWKDFATGNESAISILQTKFQNELEAENKVKKRKKELEGEIEALNQLQNVWGKKNLSKAHEQAKQDLKKAKGSKEVKAIKKKLDQLIQIKNDFIKMKQIENKRNYTKQGLDKTLNQEEIQDIFAKVSDNLKKKPKNFKQLIGLERTEKDLQKDLLTKRGSKNQAFIDSLEQGAYTRVIKNGIGILERDAQKLAKKCALEFEPLKFRERVFGYSKARKAYIETQRVAILEKARKEAAPPEAVFQIDSEKMENFKQTKIVDSKQIEVVDFEQMLEQDQKHFRQFSELKNQIYMESGIRMYEIDYIQASNKLREQGKEKPTLEDYKHAMQEAYQERGDFMRNAILNKMADNEVKKLKPYLKSQEAYKNNREIALEKVKKDLENFEKAMATQEATMDPKQHASMPEKDKAKIQKSTKEDISIDLKDFNKKYHTAQSQVKGEALQEYSDKIVEGLLSKASSSEQKIQQDLSKQQGLSQGINPTQLPPKADKQSRMNMQKR